MNMQSREPIIRHLQDRQISFTWTQRAESIKITSLLNPSNNEPQFQQRGRVTENQFNESFKDCTQIHSLIHFHNSLKNLPSSAFLFQKKKLEIQFDHKKCDSQNKCQKYTISLHKFELVPIKEESISQDISNRSRKGSNNGEPINQSDEGGQNIAASYPDNLEKDQIKPLRAAPVQPQQPQTIPNFLVWNKKTPFAKCFTIEQKIVTRNSYHKNGGWYQIVSKIPLKSSKQIKISFRIKRYSLKSSIITIGLLNQNRIKEQISGWQGIADSIGYTTSEENHEGWINFIGKKKGDVTKPSEFYIEQNGILQMTINLKEDTVIFCNKSNGRNLSVPVPLGEVKNSNMFFFASMSEEGDRVSLQQSD